MTTTETVILCDACWRPVSPSQPHITLKQGAAVLSTTHLDCTESTLACTACHEPCETYAALGLHRCAEMA